MIKLYTTGCPKCKILETKLKEKDINFIIENDVSIMESKGFQQAPMLEIDGEMMDFGTAVKWVNNQ